MKAALIALDSTECSGKHFERFSDAVRLFQRSGIIPRSDIASVYHPSLTLLPHEIFEKEKDRLVMETRMKIRKASRGRFDFRSAKVVVSPSPSTEDHVRSLSRFGKRLGAELLVVGSHERTGFPHWLLGSFSETAAQRSELPVLVFKSRYDSQVFSESPRFVLAVDLAAPPPENALQWICDLARSAEATLELLYVIPRHRPFFDSFQERRGRQESEDVMRGLKRKCVEFGAATETHVIDETASIAQSIADFADDAKAWLVAVYGVERSKVRKFIFGSRALHLLTLTNRPFLSLRLT